MSWLERHVGAGNTAEEFVLAAMELSGNIDNNRLIAPTMVCFAFAIELFLKEILAEEELDPGMNHKLLDLYKMLPDHRKSWVHRMYADLVGPTDLDIFEMNIARWSESFTTIRYWHDETGKDRAWFDFSNFVPNLAVAINNGYLHTRKFERFCFPQIDEGVDLKERVVPGTPDVSAAICPHFVTRDRRPSAT